MTKETTAAARLFCPVGEPADYLIADAATIGCDPRNEIVLAAASIAPKLARIVFDAQTDSYTLESLSSSSHTRVDGAIVKQSVRLRDLNVITLGDRDFIFVRLRGERARSEAASSAQRASKPQIAAPYEQPDSDQPAAGTLFAKIKKIAVPAFLNRGREEKPPPTSESTIAQKRGRIATPRFLGSTAGPAQPTAGSSVPGQAFLIVTLADGEREYALSEGEHLVGRSEDCDIPLKDSTVSRKHAVIELESGEIHLRDLNSVNYTFLDDRRVTSQVRAGPGSSIRFGSVEARIEMRGPTHE